MAPGGRRKMNLLKRVSSITSSLTIKLIICVVGSVVVMFGVMGYLNIQQSREHMEELVLINARGIGDIIKRSARLSMLENRRDELYQLINQIGHEPGLVPLLLQDHRQAGGQHPRVVELGDRP